MAMELKDFIVKTVGDIADAVEECRKRGSELIRITSREKAGDIDFDIAITVDEKTGGNGAVGGGIKVLGVELKAGIDEKNEVGKSQASRIRFGLNLIHKTK